MKITIKKNNINDLDRILLLSKKVFNPTPEEIIKYHNKEDWVSKIENRGLLLSASIDNDLIGFAICYKKDQDILHIWNVGVNSDFRKKGIWKRLYTEITNWAKINKYKGVSLNTYQQKFPHMYSFVKSNNFTLVHEEIVDNQVKSYFKLIF